MASAIPVPGQPGRLFIPGVGVIDQRFGSGRPVAGIGNLEGTYMKTSDVQMTQTELATLQGLSGVGQLRLPANFNLKIARDSLSPAVQQQLAAKADIKAAAVQQKQATEAAAQQQQATTLADKLKALVKNPYVIGGVVVVLGAVGFLVWSRRNRSVAQVSAVETLSLEGIKPKRKKRRKSRKSKK